MPTTKEIKNRIRSVSDTQKITNAMYLIASKKMRRAKENLDQTRPYFEAVSKEIKRVFRINPEITSKYFYPPKDVPDQGGPRGFLVITADKGLAGAYNQNLVRKTREMVRKHGSGHDYFYVVGEFGRRFFDTHGIPVEQSFLYTAQNPTIGRAREITTILLDRFEKDLERIYIVYTDMASMMNEEAKFERLLPFHRADFKSPTVEREIHHPFDFYPSLETVLDTIVPTYVTGYIYSALIDSFCSEQYARMSAMETASQNAGDLIRDLNSQYNHIRQGAITREITEISAGAKAMQRIHGNDR